MPDSEREVNDAELVQRRERGRLAQQAFRRRQIEAIRELKEDNKALREAIKELSRVAVTGFTSSHNSQAQLQAAIHKALHVAGLDPYLVQPLAHKDEVGDAQLNVPEIPSQPGLVEKQTDPSADFLSLGAPLLPVTSASNTIHSQVAAAPSVGYQQNQGDATSGGRMSPRLTYGLWFESDRAIRMVHPPLDIVPYIGEGMRSLAGTIFWTGMGFSLGAFRTIMNARYRGILIDRTQPSSLDDSEDTSDTDADLALSLSVFRHAQPMRRQLLSAPSVIAGGPDDEVVEEPHEDEVLDNDDTFIPTNPMARPHPTNSQKHKRYRRRVRIAQSIITRMFGPTTRQFSDQLVHDIIHARFTWRSKGWIAGDHPGRDPDAPARLFAAVLSEADHPAGYGEMHMWMTPVEIETYLQGRLKMTRNGWGPWAEALAGKGEAGRIQMLNQLVDMFVLNGMCFGDGPRWRADWVAMWTEEWIQGIAAGEAGVGFWF